MRYKLFAVLPLARWRSAPVRPSPRPIKIMAPAAAPAGSGGPDDVAQKFYDTQIQNRTQDPAALRPYLSDGLAQLLNDARQDPANSKNYCRLIRSPAAAPRQTAPWSPAPPPSRTAMRATFRCASI